MTTDIGDGTDSEYKAKLAELLDQLNGVTKRGTRAQVAKTHNKLAHHYVAGRDHEMAIEQFERELDIRKESGEPVAQEACFNNIGSMYYESGRMDLAIAWFTEALTLATTRANSRAVSLAHVNLALAHQRSKQFVQSGHFASLVVDSQESDKPILVSALTILAAAEQHRKELGKAIAHATTALEVAEDVQDAHLLECCLNNLAAYVFESKDYGHAYTIYERCLAVASVPKHQAAALYHMGVCAAEQNHVQVADAHFTRAIDVANSCNAPALVALAQGCLGMLCFFRENLYDAHAELVMALQTARFARSPVAEANIATGLGTVSVMESKFDESATYFESDLAIATTHDDKYGQLRAHCNLGINYLLSGDSSHAMHHFRSNLKIATVLGNKKEQALAYFGMGSAATEMKRHGIAMESTDEPLQLFLRQKKYAVDVGDKRLQAMASKAMVNLYDKQGAYEMALAECEHLMAAADAVGDVPLMAESYATMASLLSSQLALLMQRGGSRFQDTINQLTQKRDDVCAKYKVLYDTGKLHPSLRRQDVDRVVLLPWE
ncbi:hypothetical protein H257_03069 [Aphanomyces astaci]|uniref:MalT-like TPR region domain-containing protein n=1 Tax=Aphanomyces astaci TaxID=112090 RepID=W4H1X9_APHAT|nr:hypothetical protein H257_03069 [Aphanomyces astaci]ETV85264.1 hypothetical protein H257_03069 [Aphanomyces astaci]|eukprot:XP_009825282.1 hypothetical protein H257_03069 [Aphanomyces astaci]